jgi:hypothetical protein
MGDAGRVGGGRVNGRSTHHRGHGLEDKLPQHVSHITVRATDADRLLDLAEEGTHGDPIADPQVALCVRLRATAASRIWNAVEEATNAAQAGQHPVAIVKSTTRGRRRRGELAVLPLPEFQGLLAALLRAGGAW